MNQQFKSSSLISISYLLLDVRTSIVGIARKSRSFLRVWRVGEASISLVDSPSNIRRFTCVLSLLLPANTYLFFNFLQNKLQAFRELVFGAKEGHTRVSTSTKKHKKKPLKTLCHFSLKLRFQRLFTYSKTVVDMRWHVLDNCNDGLMRHPGDGEVWERFVVTHPEFASEAVNVQLGLSSDGFNSFGTMSTTYSIWHVVLIPYNHLPWLCMKQPNFILSMLIPGPCTLGNNIDVYLQPLIRELIDLWSKGIQTFEASSNEMFKMRAVLMWTISNFLALDVLSR